MKNDDNVLDGQIAKRQKVMNQVLANNELEEVLSHAEMGDAGAIFARFVYVEPEKGGFRDIGSDETLYEEAEAMVAEELEGGAENTWDLYNSVGEKIREFYADDPDFKLYKKPRPTVEDELQAHRSEAIEEMAKSRGQGV